MLFWESLAIYLFSSLGLAMCLSQYLSTGWSTRYCIVLCVTKHSFNTLCVSDIRIELCSMATITLKTDFKAAKKLKMLSPWPPSVPKMLSYHYSVSESSLGEQNVECARVIISRAEIKLGARPWKWIRRCRNVELRNSGIPFSPGQQLQIINCGRQERTPKVSATAPIQNCQVCSPV